MPTWVVGTQPCNSHCFPSISYPGSTYNKYCNPLNSLSHFETLWPDCASHLTCVCCLQDHSVEIQQFCLEFSQIREATALYKLLKNLENPDAAAKAWAVVVLSCMFSFHMYLQWQCIGMVLFYTLIGWVVASLWHTFSNPMPAHAEIGLHWYVCVLEFCGQSLHADNVLLTQYGLIHFWMYPGLSC